MGYELVAAVDLGSNSFRLQVGRVVDDQIYPLDSLKEPVRLAAGLTAQKILDGPSQLRGLEALARFGERLRGFDPGAVRAVATNALRVAKNAPQFLSQAEAALGFPIEIIAGREEARLIYLGVAHTLPNPRTQQLVVDIGGGSTEFVIGRDIEPIELESLYMGCVGFSLKYFPRGRIEKSGMKEAELAARKELQAIVRQYRKTGWEEAVGSSGTAKALADILDMNGLSGAGEAGITRDGLERLRGILLHAGDVGRLTLQGLRPDRLLVLPGGLAIMLAVFKEFGLERMTFSEGAARGFLLQLLPEAAAAELPDAQVLDWAALMHEIGISVAHSSYHKHSAYILANADMPGFSKMDQARLSRIVLAHRGKLERVQEIMPDSVDWLLIISLRLAVILHRSRDDAPLPAITVRRNERGFGLGVDPQWLAASPLSAAALEEEGRQWAGLGMEIRLKSGRGKSQSAA
jgi:exopolyphosphatase/guanosine-5'-triphosphate,3'-diphosphate pyrophosphatase